MGIFDFSKSDLFLIQFVDDRSSIVYGNSFPTLLLHFNEVAVLDHALQIGLNLVNVFLRFGHHHHFAISAHLEVDVFRLSIDQRMFEKLHNSHNVVVRVTQGQFLLFFNFGLWKLFLLILLEIDKTLFEVLDLLGLLKIEERLFVFLFFIKLLLFWGGFFRMGQKTEKSLFLLIIVKYYFNLTVKIYFLIKIKKFHHLVFFQSKIWRFHFGGSLIHSVQTMFNATSTRFFVKQILHKKIIQNFLLNVQSI